ncbi:unnamed protein product, partial [Staurois parvus]
YSGTQNCLLRDTELLLRDTELLLRDTELLLRDTELLLRDTELLLRDTELLLIQTQNFYSGTQNCYSGTQNRLIKEYVRTTMQRSGRGGNVLGASRRAAEEGVEAALVAARGQCSPVSSSGRVSTDNPAVIDWLARSSSSFPGHL